MHPQSQAHLDETPASQSSGLQAFVRSGAASGVFAPQSGRCDAEIGFHDSWWPAIGAPSFPSRALREHFQRDALDDEP